MPSCSEHPILAEEVVGKSNPTCSREGSREIQIRAAVDGVTSSVRLGQQTGLGRKRAEPPACAGRGVSPSMLSTDFHPFYFSVLEFSEGGRLDGEPNRRHFDRWWSLFERHIAVHHLATGEERTAKAWLVNIRDGCR